MIRFSFALVAAFLMMTAGCAHQAETSAIPRHKIIVPAADASAVQVQSGYRVELVVSGLTYPSSVEFDGVGGMYIAEAGLPDDPGSPPQILRVSANGDITRVTEGLVAPIMDLLWYDHRLYVSHRGKISIVDEDGRVRDIVSGLPSNGDYHNNQLTVGPDEKIYVGQGTATNSGIVGIDSLFQGWLAQHPDVHDLPAVDLELREQTFETPNPFSGPSTRGVPRVKTSAFQPFGRTASSARGAMKPNGAILRMNPDGSELEVYAWGLRNPMGAGWDPDGNFYVAEESYDERGSRPIANAPDNVYVVQQGAWYGWPDFVSGLPVTDTRFRPGHGDQPDFLLKDHPPVETPWVMLPPHAGVAKMDFSRSRRFGFHGHMFLALAGNLDREELRDGGTANDPGSQVVRIDPVSREVHTFLWTRQEAVGPVGLEHIVTAGLKRPIDVRFSPRGDSLFVVDLGAMAPPVGGGRLRAVAGTGAVWRVTRDEARRGVPWKVVPVAMER